MEIIKRDPQDWFTGKEKEFRFMLIAVNYPNPECRKVTVGYFKDGSFFDFLDNELYFDDGHVPHQLSKQFVEWWAEIPKFEEFK